MTTYVLTEPTRSMCQTAMALWEAVLDVRKDVLMEQEFIDTGWSMMRHQAMELIPLAEAAWDEIKDTYEDQWDWDFLPLIVALWMKAEFDHTKLTVAQIVEAVNVQIH